MHHTKSSLRVSPHPPPWQTVYKAAASVHADLRPVSNGFAINHTLKLRTVQVTAAGGGGGVLRCLAFKIQSSESCPQQRDRRWRGTQLKLPLALLGS